MFKGQRLYLITAPLTGPAPQIEIYLLSLGDKLSLFKTYIISDVYRTMEKDLGSILKVWRKARGLKQQALAELLGITQASVSRWENGIDHPSAVLRGKIRDLLGDKLLDASAVDFRALALQPGLRALVDLDGWRLLAVNQSFKATWPELGEFVGQRFADYLIGQTADLYHDSALISSVKRAEVKLVAGVSDRHLSGFGDNAFRHYWAASFRKIGSLHCAEISFESCQPNAEVGLRHILRVEDVD